MSWNLDASKVYEYNSIHAYCKMPSLFCIQEIHNRGNGEGVPWKSGEVVGTRALLGNLKHIIKRRRLGITSGAYLPLRGEGSNVGKWSFCMVLPCGQSNVACQIRNFGKSIGILALQWQKCRVISKAGILMLALCKDDKKIKYLSVYKCRIQSLPEGQSRI